MDHSLFSSSNYNHSDHYDFAKKTPFALSLKAGCSALSMQVVMNKCFLLNPEKKCWRRFVLSFSRKTHILIPKNDVTEPKARLL